MLLICPNCKAKNFLDPYPFWDFKGTTKCAGCNTIWRIETSRGACVFGPEKASGTPDLLPGFAEKQDYSALSGPGLTRPAPRARADSVCKPIPIERNVRGKIISGHPLKKEDLAGSKPKFMAARSR
ncbi:MAG TPA: hypothetical protein VED66_11295 [Candidatus Sulfotelmatobacter sp.]|nr:hypothetical protein [Candidatus Sulfotelmatobacter sp.]